MFSSRLRQLIMKLIAFPYNSKNRQDIITFQSNYDYIKIKHIIKNINNFLDDNNNYWLNEMCVYFDLEEL